MRSFASHLVALLERLRAGGLRAGELAGRVAAFSVRRRAWVLATALAIGAAFGLLALRLDATSGAGALVEGDGSAAKATKSFHRQFGDEPITVMIRGRRHTAACGRVCHLTDLLLTQDLAKIVGLEGCLSGNLPRGVKPPAPVCSQFARTKPIRFVLGPGTFINESARQIAGRFQADRGRRAAEERRAEQAARQVARAKGLGVAEQERLARQARQLVDLQFQRRALELALRYGLTSAPALNNPEFVLKLVFEPRLGAGVPKSRFAYLFPSDRSALIQARLRPGLTETERRGAIDLVNEAVTSPAFRLERGEYIVSGSPVVAEGVRSSVSGDLAPPLLLAVLLVAVVLALAFRARLRLLPLALALLSAALTFGIMSLAGTSLTIGSLAVLPVLIGLATGWVVQFQAHFAEEAVEDAPPGQAGGPPFEQIAAEAEAARAARHAAVATRAIGVGALAAMVALLATLLAPLPMTRSFGGFVLLGFVLALGCGLTVGVAALGGRTAISWPARRLRLPSLRRRPRLRGAEDHSRPARVALPGPVRSAGSAFLSSARPIVRRSRSALGRAGTVTGRGAGRLVGMVARRPGRVLAIALAAATLGWVLDSRVAVVSDPRGLASSDVAEIQDAKTVERETGLAGEVNVLVEGRDLTTPRVVSWMAGYEDRVLRRHGYSDQRSCRSAELCPSLSLTNLLGGARGASASQVKALLKTLPPYFTQSVISPDRRTGNIAFGIRAASERRKRDVIDDMRAELHPPPGVSAELAGLPVEIADSGADLDSGRRTVTALALAAILLVLLLAYGRSERSLAPLIAVALATGWIGLVTWVLAIPVNPLSAVLGALIVAVAAQLALLFSAAYREQRAGGHPVERSVDLTFRRIHSVALASAASVLAGFAALAASDVRMLRDFGVLALVALVVVLAGMALVLPAALVWMEGRRGVRVPRSRAEAAALAESVRATAGAALAAIREWARAGGRGALGLARRARGAIGRARRSRGARRREEAQRP